MAAKETDSSLRSWYRPQTELKDSEYWTYIVHHVNLTGDDMSVLHSHLVSADPKFQEESVSAGLV